MSDKTSRMDLDGRVAGGCLTISIENSLGSTIHGKGFGRSSCPDCGVTVAFPRTNRGLRAPTAEEGFGEQLQAPCML